MGYPCELCMYVPHATVTHGVRTSVFRIASCPSGLISPCPSGLSLPGTPLFLVLFSFGGQPPLSFVMFSALYVVHLLQVGTPCGYCTCMEVAHSASLSLFPLSPFLFLGCIQVFPSMDVFLLAPRALYAHFYIRAC